MSSAVNYENTYWSHKGTYPAANKALAALVPPQDEIPDAKNNPALEKFRVASNCYYDLYNNGLVNRAKEFRAVFGFSGKKLMTMDHQLSQELIDKTEAAMDQIIVDAAKEQKIALDKSPEERYKAALESIASMWPDPGMCAELVPEHIGPNDGRMRAEMLWYALNDARKALGKTPYPRPEYLDAKIGAV